MFFYLDTPRGKDRYWVFEGAVDELEQVGQGEIWAVIRGEFILVAEKYSPSKPIDYDVWTFTGYYVSHDIMTAWEEMKRISHEIYEHKKKYDGSIQWDQQYHHLLNKMKSFVSPDQDT